MMIPTAVGETYQDTHDFSRAEFMSPGVFQDTNHFPSPSRLAMVQTPPDFYDPNPIKSSGKHF